MSAEQVVRARIDAELKRKATAVLSEMGLSVSDAIRMLLVRVAAERALPFEVRMPNKATQEAIKEIRDGNLDRFESVDALMADLNEHEEA